MSVPDPLTTKWDDLSRKRQDVLRTAYEVFDSETFACGELNEHLSEPTTTTTLNNISVEDGYLRRWPGGNQMLLAIIVGEEDKTAYGPAQEEDLAKRMVRREGLALDAEAVNWADNDEREAFAEEFNARSVEVKLDATWTRNKYRLRPEAREIVGRNLLPA